MAAGTASPPPKIADPATRTLAPAANCQPSRTSSTGTYHAGRRAGCTVAYRIRASSRASLEFAVATDQIVRRTVMAELGLGLAHQLGDDALGQYLAEFDAPLVERVDVPDGALGEDVMLVQCDQLAKRGRRQPVACVFCRRPAPRSGRRRSP